MKDDAGNVIVRKDRKFTSAAVRKLREAGVEWIQVGIEDILRDDNVRRVVPVDIVDERTGEVLIECNEEITERHLEELKNRGISEFPLLYLDPLITGTSLRDTLLADKTVTREEAIIDIYRRLRPGDPPTIDTATNLFHNLFFNPERYDLSRVGRLKLNHKLAFEPEERVTLRTQGASGAGEEVALGELTTLRPEDIRAAVRYLVDLKNGSDPDKRIDDIDHLGNRRVRVVGELLENQYRIGLVRMERAIKERMSLQEIETLMPHDLINSKPVSAVIKEFFGSSQLSQFMDQTNPLSAVTHKRRLSALGPGGLTRERAGFEVRDVHPTHYGRICPIETPEGPNIGLIASLSTYARVNGFGFIETPYRVVRQGQVTERGEVPLGARGGAARDRPGQRARRRAEPLPGGERLRAQDRRVHDGAAGRGGDDGRLAEPAGVGGGLAHPVPRERRREPRAHGLEHAAPGRAAAAHPGAARRHRHGGRGRAGLGRHGRREARRHGRVGRRRAGS